MYDANNIAIAPHNLPINAPIYALSEGTCLSGNYDVKQNNASYKYEYTWNNTKYELNEIINGYQGMMRRGYYASVSFMDDQFGRIIKGLYQYNLWNNTIVVFTGDHGWQLGEQGNWCKRTNFELSARVPLIIRIPDPNNPNKGIYTVYTIHVHSICYTNSLFARSNSLSFYVYSKMEYIYIQIEYNIRNTY